MTHTALKVASQIPYVDVIDLIRITPTPSIIPTLRRYARVVTLEEHFVVGGLGSIVLEACNDASFRIPVLRIGVPAEYTFTYGGREAIWEKYKLTPQDVAGRIQTWLDKESP
jgi:transketolase